jgi:ribosomal protein S1
MTYKIGDNLINYHNHIGKIFQCSIKKITDYGIFIILPNKDEGFIHNSEISWTKDKPEYNLGQIITVKLIKIDKFDRLILSIKETIEDPKIKFWQESKVGDSFIGKVIKLHPYGVTVMSDIGVRALCHKLSFNNREFIKDVEYSFKILEIDSVQSRILIH